jgi:peptidoglycan hydrolase-like protein with peptidoglycan-binding domain
MKRRWLILGVVAVGATAAGVTAATRQPSTADNGSTATTNPRETAKVTRTDLVDENSLRGTLGYGEATPINGVGSGTITALPEPGTVIRQGDGMWQVDDHAGPALFYGSLPLWRTLQSGMTAGADVAQLEQNLTDLGFGADLTVDGKFDSTTTAAIKAWQASRGLRKTGVVNPGDVIVAARALRVAELHAGVGGQATGEILTATGAGQVVTLAVALDKVALLKSGAAVKVELPDDSRVDATVGSVGRVATVKQDGAAATIDATVTMNAPVESLDAAPVNVIVTTPKASGVLVVPIRALLALAEGGYAVERVSGNTTALVAVKPGDFGDGIVAVTGTGLAEGDTVVVAP